MKQIMMWETEDGQLFKDEVVAKQHDKKFLFHKALGEVCEDRMVVLHIMTTFTALGNDVTLENLNEYFTVLGRLARKENELEMLKRIETVLNVLHWNRKRLTAILSA